MKEDNILNASDLDDILEDTPENFNKNVNKLMKDVEDDLITYIGNKVNEFFYDYDYDDYYNVLEILKENNHPRAVTFESDIQSIMDKWEVTLDAALVEFKEELY